MRKIERIFGEDLNWGESQAFHFVPKKKDKKVIGLLFSGNVGLSLSFDNGTDLKFNQDEVSHYPVTSPDKRIVRLNEQLTGKAIKGTVECLPVIGEGFFFPGEGSCLANVYLIIEQE